MIQIKGLDKKYGNIHALRDLNLEIPKGELFVLLGPNAAGKTTTIKILAGLLLPTKGSVSIAGIDIQKDPLSAKRKTSYIPDFPYVYEKLTAREFMEFVADMHELSLDTSAYHMDELISYFELENVQDVLLENFSHGMKQRLVFCASILTRPEVFIIDEPMVGLDPKSARLVKDILKKLSREGTTLFVSTHTLSFAEELADRIGIIYQGSLLVDGSREEIMRYSKTETDNLEKAFLEITKHSVLPADD